MKLIFTLILSSYSLLIFSQEIEKVVVTSATNSVYNADVIAYKTYNNKDVRQFLAENYSFPSEAYENEISGTIYAEFVVEKDGLVKNVTIEKGLCKTCDEEAVRVIKKLRFQPIEINGKAERVRFRVPIRLVLE